MKNTQTQIESYKQIDFANKLQKIIYYYLKAMPNKSSQEIADNLHLRRTTVIARLNELKSMCLIEVSEIKESRNTARKNEFYSIVKDFYSALDTVQLKMWILQDKSRYLKLDYDRVVFVFTIKLIESEIKSLKKQLKELERAEKILTQFIHNEN